MARDAVDLVLEQWAGARPDLDASPMRILGRLSRVTRIAERELKNLFNEFGLERGEFDVLATLRRAGSGTQRHDRRGAGPLLDGDLGRRHQPARPARREGLRHPRVRPANRRTVIVALTPTGRDLIDRAVVAHVENERRILAALDDRQQDDLAATLRTLLLSLGDEAP